MTAGYSEVRNYPCFSRKTCLQWPDAGEIHYSFYIKIPEEERVHLILVHSAMAGSSRFILAGVIIFDAARLIFSLLFNKIVKLD